jgi:hypothetical protein
LFLISHLDSPRRYAPPTKPSPMTYVVKRTTTFGAHRGANDDWSHLPGGIPQQHWRQDCHRPTHLLRATGFIKQSRQLHRRTKPGSSGALRQLRLPCAACQTRPKKMMLGAVFMRSNLSPTSPTKIQRTRSVRQERDQPETS